MPGLVRMWLSLFSLERFEGVHIRGRYDTMRLSCRLDGRRAFVSKGRRSREDHMTLEVLYLGGNFHAILHVLWSDDLSCGTLLWTVWAEADAPRRGEACWGNARGKPAIS